MGKKYITIAFLMLCAVMIAFSGCTKTEKKKEEKPKDTEKMEAPYIGYATLNERTNRMLETVQQSFDGSPRLSLLEYDAAGNNKAIVRLERSKEDGKWEVLEEKNLLLTHNAKKGYMSLLGDANFGFTLNTDLIDLETKNGDTIINKIAFSPVEIKKEKSKEEEKESKKDNNKNDKETNKDNNKEDDESSNEKSSPYSVSKMFGTFPEELSEKELLAENCYMEMTMKRVLQIDYEKEGVYELGERVVSADDADSKEVDISKVYRNKDNKYADAYTNQSMVALTIEFTVDDEMAKTPYISFTSDNKELKNEKDSFNVEYNSGEYQDAIIGLEKLKSDGTWETVEEESLYLPYSQNSGVMKVDGSFLKDGVKIDAEKLKSEDGKEIRNGADIAIPENKDENLKIEVSAFDRNDKELKAEKKFVLKMVQGVKVEEYGDQEIDEEVNIEKVISSGVKIEDIYHNTGGSANNILTDNDTILYALTIRFE